MAKHPIEWAIASHSCGKLDAFVPGEIIGTIGVCCSVASAAFLIPPWSLSVYDIACSSLSLASISLPRPAVLPFHC
jgi:hypothetical protein